MKITSTDGGATYTRFLIHFTAVHNDMFCGSQLSCDVNG